MARSKHGTRADSTYASLRADILAGRLQPGERLKFPELCERYGVGVGVVREALTRLVEQQVVRSQPHLGFQVAPLSSADLLELTVARIEIEGLVLRHSIEQGDVTWESEVISKHHALERTPQRDADDPGRVSDEWSAAHSDFHVALLNGCSNARLRAVAISMRDAAELYQRWSQQQQRHSNRDVIGEHRTLMELAIARNADAAVAALSDHIRLTTKVLLRHPDAARENERIAAD